MFYAETDKLRGLFIMLKQVPVRMIKIMRTEEKEWPREGINKSN